MRTLLLAPHADDETLFASYLAQRHAAHIFVVYDEGRIDELHYASHWLGCRATQLSAWKGMDPEEVEVHLNAAFDPQEWDRVILPIPFAAGHEEHTLVGEIALRLFAGCELIQYATYGPRGVRQQTATEVIPYDPAHYARKLAALSCYRTPIATVATRPWFVELLDMREWIA